MFSLHLCIGYRIQLSSSTVKVFYKEVFMTTVDINIIESNSHFVIVISEEKLAITITNVINDPQAITYYLA